jgi:hypothetical protein
LLHNNKKPSKAGTKEGKSINNNLSILKHYKVMKTKDTLNTDRRLFLVKFAWTITGGQLITTQDQLANAIKDNDPGRGIEYIKEFNPVKGSFQKVSKKQILNYLSWDTEATEILSKHTFFN